MYRDLLKALNEAATPEQEMARLKAAVLAILTEMADLEGEETLDGKPIKGS